MRSRGKCSGSGRRAGRRRSNGRTSILSVLAPLGCHLRSRLGFGCILLEIGEFEFELLELRRALR